VLCTLGSAILSHQMIARAMPQRCDPPYNPRTRRTNDRRIRGRVGHRDAFSTEHPYSDPETAARELLERRPESTSKTSTGQCCSATKHANRIQRGAQVRDQRRLVGIARRNVCEVHAGARGFCSRALPHSVHHPYGVSQVADLPARSIDTMHSFVNKVPRRQII
jgi:hypothetical protein